MEENSELVRLEQFVDKLLNRYNELKKSHESLKSILAERDNECVDFKRQVTELDSERVVVGERVAGLIGRIEEWEAEQSYSGIDKDGEQHGQQDISFEGHLDR